MSRDRLMAEIRASDLDADTVTYWLDDLVHDLKSMEASDINNDGWESQLDYLLENGMTAEEIKETLGLTDAF